MVLKTLNDYAKTLNAVQKGNQWVCKCPAHDDTNPSLWLSESGGKVLWHCFSGCSQEAVGAALEGLGLFLGIGGSKSGRVPLPPGIPHLYPTASMLKRLGQVPGVDNQKLYAAHYTYRAANGAILGFTVRYERDGRKDIIPFFKVWRGGEWRSGHALVSGRPLYGLAALASNPDHVVYIVEGEKCADLINIRFSDTVVAVTWPGGSKSPKKCDWSSLAGRDVIIWPDYDSAGVGAASSVANLLSGIARSVSFVDLSALAAGGGIKLEGDDCVDYFNNLPGTPLPLGTLKECPTVPFGKVPEPPAVKKEKKEAPILNLKFPLTEFGNVERFIAKYGAEVCYTSESGWLIWDGKKWAIDVSKKIFAMAASILKDIPLEADRDTPPKDAQVILRWAHSCAKNSAVNALVALLTTEQSLSKSYDVFDTDPYLLNCQNGTVELKTGRLRPFDRSDYITHIASVPFLPGSPCPTWERFLDDTFEGRDDVIAFFQRAAGYCITGDTSEQVFFTTEGPGGSGKGAAFGALEKVLGTYAQQIQAQAFLLDASGGSATGDNSVASIRGARLCLSSEINTGARLNEARVKELTGQDTIQARFLYHEYFSFKPVAKFWLRCNALPVIQGGDSGIWRRIRLLPFKAAIEESKKDYYLDKKLLLEGAGILSWCVQGCLDWQAKRLQPPSSCTIEALKYREDMDLVGLWLSERCVAEEGTKTQSTDLYRSYIQWCEVQGEKHRSQRWLSFELRSRGFERQRAATGSVYTGLRLKNEGMAQERADWN